MQLTPSLVPSDPALLATVLPGMGAPRSGAPVAESRAIACGTFGELFPELGATVTATATAIPASVPALPIAAAASPSPAAQPSPGALQLPAVRQSSGALPATAPSLPTNVPFSATSALNDQTAHLAPDEAASPESHDKTVERRSQMPATRRFSEKHRETFLPPESPAPAERVRERAVADIVVVATPAQPVAPAFEWIAALPEAGWELETPAPSLVESELKPASPLPKEKTPATRDDRPLSQAPQSVPSPQARISQVWADATTPRSREFPAYAPTPESKSPPTPSTPSTPSIPSTPVPMPDFGVPLARLPDAPRVFPREIRGERIPIEPPAGEQKPLEPPVSIARADIASSRPEPEVRLTTNRITPQAELAAYAPTLPAQTTRLPELIPMAVRPEPSELLESVALTPSSEAPSADDLETRLAATGFAENIVARALGESSVESAKKRPIPVAAKFAAEALRDAVAPIDVRTVAVKTFVNAAPELLTRHRPELGIGVAKPAATMSERLIPALPPHPMPEYGTVAPALEIRLAPEVTQQAAAITQENAPVEAVNSAQRAVEVALRAVDVAAVAGEQKSVNLDFAVGDADLSVRIEIRADEVHTTFRTDSAELRTALAQEWQSVATSPASERALRLAPATFASADAPAPNASGGDASSRERHSQAQQSENAHAAFTSAGRARAAASDHSVSATTAIRSLVAAATSRHLHTLA